MQKMKTRLVAGLMAMLLVSGLAMADVVKMKDGTEYVGKITLETSDIVKIEIKSSSTIKDSKLLKRADIAEIKKTSPDEEAWNEIEAMVPTKSLQNASAYKKMIDTGPKLFLAKFPNSPYTTKVNDVLTVLEEELDKVERGHQKVGEEWFSPQDRDTYAMHVSSKKQLLGMKAQAARRDLFGLIEAMQNFENLENKHFGTQAHAAALKGVPEILTALNGTASRFLNDVPARQAQWQESLNSQDPTSQERMKAGRAREEANLQRQIELDKAQGNDWLPVDIRSAESMSALLSRIQSEAARLKAIDADALAARADKIFAADQLVGNDKLAEANVAILNVPEFPGEELHVKKRSSRKRPKSSSQTTEQAAPVYTSYLSEVRGKYQVKAALMAKIEQEKAELEASATAPSATTEGDGEKTEEDKAQENKVSARAALAAEKAKKEEEAKAAAEKAAKSKSKSKKSKSKPKPKDDEDKEDKPKREYKEPIPFYYYTIGIALLVGIAALVMKKMGIGGSKDE